jgi:hypothetical protein
VRPEITMRSTARRSPITRLIAAALMGGLLAACGVNATPTPEAPLPSEAASSAFTLDRDTVTLAPQAVAPGEGAIDLQITLPDGYKINDVTDSTVAFSGGAEAVTVSEAQTVVDTPTLSIPATFSAGTGTLQADLTLYYCRIGEEAVCFIDAVTFDAPVEVAANAGATTLSLPRIVEPPPDAGS